MAEAVAIRNKEVLSEIRARKARGGLSEEPSPPRAMSQSYAGKNKTDIAPEQAENMIRQLGLERHLQAATLQVQNDVASRFSDMPSNLTENYDVGGMLENNQVFQGEMAKIKKQMGEQSKQIVDKAMAQVRGQVEAAIKKQVQRQVQRLATRTTLRGLYGLLDVLGETVITLLVELVMLVIQFILGNVLKIDEKFGIPIPPLALWEQLILGVVFGLVIIGLVISFIIPIMFGLAFWGTVGYGSYQAALGINEFLGLFGFDLINMITGIAE